MQVGDDVEVMVLEIDESRRRISLGMKQCKANPWDEFSDNHKKNDKVVGKIKSITDFGIFIGLNGEIDGLVHLSDLSWNLPGEEAVKNYKKGDELEAVVLSIDVDRERISLGVKQMDGDPFANYVSVNEKGASVQGEVEELDEKGAIVKLDSDVRGYMRSSDFGDLEDFENNELKVGSKVSAFVTNIDRKNRAISLSIKAKEHSEEKAAIKKHSEEKNDGAGTTNLGALLKAKLTNKD